MFVRTFLGGGELYDRPVAVVPKKKPLGFHVCKKIETKKTSEPSQQNNNTGQLTPKSLIFDFNDGDQNARRGPYYAMLPSRSTGISHVVGRSGRSCVRLRR